MEKHSSPMMRLTRRRAAFRLRQLMDEIHMLTSAFPDLHDAFDPDELPLAFILWRDSRQAEGRAPSRPFSPRPSRAGHRRTRLSHRRKAPSS